jgi:hypothetical protein
VAAPLRRPGEPTWATAGAKTQIRLLRRTDRRRTLPFTNKRRSHFSQKGCAVMLLNLYGVGLLRSLCNYHKSGGP